MDAFYASVEQLENPELQGKPIVVGGNAERGVIAAASYEARKFGIFSAMSSKVAAKMCPGLIFVKPDFAKYKRYSKAIHEVFHRYTDIIEPLSLDEAFLDVTENKIGQRSATFIANAIKNEILADTGLIASAGVSYCKFFAKLASDQDKPNGLFIITPEDAPAYIEKLPVGKFFGVGKVTADKMNKMGIFKGKDLLPYSEVELLKFFGKSGSFLYRIVRGIDTRPVEYERERKSVGAETTFDRDLVEKDEIYEQAMKILDEVWQRCKKHDKFGRTLTLKIKYNDFRQITRNRTLTHAFEDIEMMREEAKLLLELVFPLEKSIRLIGFSVSGFEEGEKSLVQGVFGFK